MWSERKVPLTGGSGEINGSVMKRFAALRSKIGTVEP
jgi:hypothetical protein